MRYLSAYYRQEDSALSLILQQVTRQKGDIPILFAGIFEQKMLRKAELGDEVDRDAPPKKLWLAEYLTEWFYEKALPGCEKRKQASCVDMAQGLFAESLRRFEWENGDSAAGAMAVLFAMGQECFYAWRGEAEITLMNMSFGRLHARSLTGLSEETLYERAFWETETGLVLGMREFCDHLPQGALRDCLGVRGLEQEVQVERHLAEAAAEAARRGAKETTTLFVVAREGQDWRPERDTVRNKGGRKWAKNQSKQE